MEHAIDNFSLDNRSISVDTQRFFALESPKRIRRHLSIHLTGHCYLPKAEDPRSDWVASVAYPAFVAVRQMNIGSNIGRFASIGTGAGIDALAAIEVFGCREVVVTDMHEDVVNMAARNIANNIAEHSPVVTVSALVGDLLAPLSQTVNRFDLIYENLPNIPFHQDGNLQHDQTSSSYIGTRREDVPGFIHKNLLTLHYLAILQAKSRLAKNGVILSSIGARIPLSVLLQVAHEAGFTGSILTYTWKVQSEPEEVISGYAAWQKQGLGPFYFYPVEVLYETFSNIDMVAAGDQSLEIERALLPHRLDAIAAYEAYSQGQMLGHTVAVLMSRFERDAE